MVFKGRVTEAVAEGAYADVVVKLGLVRLFTKQFDLFRELSRRPEWSLEAGSGGGAPVKPGLVTVTYEGRLNKEIPQAKFTVSVRAYTVDDDALAAFDVKVDFMRPAL